MTDSSRKVKRILNYFSLFDIMLSTILIFATGLYAATCHVEDDSIITHDIGLGQIEYFYHALEVCGYKEESDIPSTEAICLDLATNVVPFAGLSLSLNYLLGVYIQIMIRDKYFFVDKEVQKYSMAISLVCIPIGTLLSMLFASIALTEYTKLCWLAHSISKQRKSVAYLVSLSVVPVTLVVYKPVELATFYWYGCSLFQRKLTNASNAEVTNVTKVGKNGESKQIPPEPEGK